MDKEEKGACAYIGVMMSPSRSEVPLLPFELVETEGGLIAVHCWIINSYGRRSVFAFQACHHGEWHNNGKAEIRYTTFHRVQDEANHFTVHHLFSVFFSLTSE